MWKNHLKIAWRSLLKNKLNSFINLFGLVVGITAVLILALVLHFEWSFDRFQPSFETGYRVISQDQYPDGIETNPGMQAPFTLELMANKDLFSKVAPAVVLYESQLTVEELKVQGGEDKFLADEILFIDTTYPEMFDLEFLAGNPQDLTKADVAFLSQNQAELMFGAPEKALGKTIQLLNGVELQIVGLVANSKENSNFQADVFASFESLRSHKEEFGYDFEEGWGSTSSNFQTYLIPNPDLSLAQVEKGLLELSEKHFEGRGNSKKSHILQPIADIHYEPDLEPISGTVARKSTLNIMVLIGVFILSMAAINYVNLSTSRAIGKSKEVGIHKVMGGARGQLINLSLTETFILVGMASLASLLLLNFAISFLPKVSNIPEGYSTIPGSMYILLIGLILLVTLLSGLYPALVISRFEPIRALKNKVQSAQLGSISLRRALMLVQFGIAQVLMIGTLILMQQMNHIRSADLGFSKDQIFMVEVESDRPSQPRIESFKQELLRLPGIKSVSLTSDTPSSDNNSASNFSYDNQSEDIPYPVFLKMADADYFDHFQLEFIAGKGYAPSDTMRQAVLNETLAKQLTGGDPASAVGKTIRLGRSQWMEISGVTKDFMPNSLREEIKPMMILTMKDYYRLATIKLDENASLETLDQIKEVYQEFYPEKLYSARFFDELIHEFYEGEEKLALIYQIFAVISLIVAGLGLYGLVSFLVSQRVKEIGIRKTLGATVPEITVLISKEFLIMVGVAFLFAIPMAYYMMKGWLETFASRIPISMGLFVLVFVVSLLLTALTVGFKAVQAAFSNPVKALKSE